MNGICHRNSRWTRKPSQGPRKTAHLSAHDFAIFEVLARHRYLPADYIHALTGGSFKYLTQRLGILSREPNLFVVRPTQQRANVAANHRYLIYELDQRGIAALQERGFSLQRTRPPVSFAHELMACEIIASFELGALRQNVRLITWRDILDSQNLPETTRRSTKPFHIPIRFEGTDAHTVADAQPFGIERVIADRRAYYFCPGIEADCGTEPIDASDVSRASIYRKFALYLAIETQQIYRSHFGFPNFYVPFITTTAARLASMMAILKRITDGQGSKIFLFKTFPAFTSFERPLPPSDHMLIEDWQRVGHPPFNFLRS
jgi:hypothetical protein